MAQGWKAVSCYDDGGFSGGNVERPGLKKLLADIAAKRIRVVVVYKVDRLTGSLADFAKLVDFDDPVHSVFGLEGYAFQSLYHFTVGGPVDDPRLTTLAPYPAGTA
jgi:Resolvase, N terminal domain